MSSCRTSDMPSRQSKGPHGGCFRSIGSARSARGDRDRRRVPAAAGDRGAAPGSAIRRRARLRR